MCTAYGSPPEYAERWMWQYRGVEVQVVLCQEEDKFLHPHVVDNAHECLLFAGIDELQGGAQDLGFFFKSF